MRRAAITLAIVLAAPAAALAQPGPGEGVTSDDGAARTMREPDRLGQPGGVVGLCTCVRRHHVVPCGPFRPICPALDKRNPERHWLPDH